ncbi:hypothetical protein [Rhizobium sp. BK251]|uniref:hypothetical protein n=1 Tax=Rhizobium sp. BK251 TaxID=2512125 RepID=UPI0010493220|nr:hypothetical protein [Rhizobium sp. BK251]TCL65122.1 hypothetical protein EV286_11317 [Rhizobium sp. BK251]
MTAKSIKAILMALAAMAGAQPALAFGPGGYAREFAALAVEMPEDEAELTRIGFVRPEMPVLLRRESDAEKAILDLTFEKHSLLLSIGAAVSDGLCSFGDDANRARTAELASD